MIYLSRREIAEWQPFREYPAPDGYAELLIGRLGKAGQWDGRQLAGNRWPIGCVALEITQRCNLDCSLCYLSEHSEAVLDLPLQEIYRRLEVILRHYGPGTDVQVTGGDPTLRKREELLAIVRKIRDMGMRPTLFTNGIRATRKLLAELAENGLEGVAFHVDLTQRRTGYATETALNEIRSAYIDRARGLPLAIYFNTTVCAENFSEIPEVVRFFRRHADSVALASFQVQADTGRGVLGRRAAFITPESVADQISQGAGLQVAFDVARAGHAACNKYAICLSVNGNLYNLFEDSSFMAGMLGKTHRHTFSRTGRWSAIRSVLAVVLADPACWPGAARYVFRKFLDMGADLLRARGKVNKLSFFVHNFMDAARLEPERCLSCVFMVATDEGPVSMCVHNAKRDAYLLRPLALETPAGRQWWHPLSGDFNVTAASGNSCGAEPPPLTMPLTMPPRALRRMRRRGSAAEKPPRRSVPLDLPARVSG